MMEPMLVRYEVRMEPMGNRWLERQPLERLEAWQRVARQSGLFRDPRCSQLLRGWVNTRRKERRGY